MAKVSNARKLEIAARIVADHLGRRRTVRAAMSGVKAAGRSFGRVIHQLWLEITGFTFLALAGIGALAGFREYTKYQTGHAAGPGRVIIAACFTATFAWFGVSSFWRVRRPGSVQGSKRKLVS